MIGVSPVIPDPLVVGVLFGSLLPCPLVALQFMVTGSHDSMSAGATVVLFES